MPRLRYYKKYEQLTEDSNNGEESSNEGINYESEKGWWSNASIIASLSETKIKAAIEAHKSFISLLQAELLSRSYNTCSDFKQLNDIKVGPHTFKIRPSDFRKECCKARTKSTRKRESSFRKLEVILKSSGLSENKIKELLELWHINLIKDT